MPATAVPTTQRRPGGEGGPRSYPRRPGSSARARTPCGPRGSNAPGARARPSSDDHEILFQKFFKSVGPRTYAAQVKRAANGNQYLVLMEGKRDDKTGEVRKTRVFVYSEDFVEFFRLVKSTAEFIKANPVPEEIRRKREKFWQRQPQQGHAPQPSPGQASSLPPPTPAAPPSRSPSTPPTRRTAAAATAGVAAGSAGVKAGRIT